MSPVLLFSIIGGVLAVLLIGGGVGGYFLFFRAKEAATAVVQVSDGLPKDAAKDLANLFKDIAKDGKKDLANLFKDVAKDGKIDLTKIDPGKVPIPTFPDPTPPVKEKEPAVPPIAFKLEISANHVAIPADGKTAVFAANGFSDQDRAIAVVELPSGKTLKKIPMPEQSMAGLGVAPDGKSAVIAGFPGFNAKQQSFARIVDLESGETKQVVQGIKGGVTCMALSPDGSLLAIAEQSPMVLRVFDLQSGQERFSVEKPHRNVCKQLAITPDNKHVISCGTDAGGERAGNSKLILWDIAAKSAKHVLTGYEGFAEGIAVSKNGKWIAAAVNFPFKGGSVRVWNAETGAESVAINTTNAGFLSNGARIVAFGPDDQSVIASFYSQTIRAFEIPSGKELGGVRDQVLSNVMAMSPDKTTLVSGEFANVKLWNFPKSLTDLAKPNDPPFGTIVRDGVPATPVVPKAETPMPTSAIAGIVNGFQDTTLYVDVNGGKRTLFLQPDTKYLDASGQALVGDNAKKAYRVGNQVAVKTRAQGATGGNDAVVEIQIVREAMDQAIHETAKFTELAPRAAKINVQGKELMVLLTPGTTKVILFDGSEAQGALQKVLNFQNSYRVVLKQEFGLNMPLLVEAKELTPGNPGTPKKEFNVREVPGAKDVKGAFVKTAKEGKKMITTLIVGSEPPFRVIVAARALAFDKAGNPTAPPNLLKDGTQVDVLVTPYQNMFMIHEIRPTGGQIQKTSQLQSAPNPALAFRDITLAIASSASP